MDYRTLGHSGCAVSALGLGTMTFGVETDEPGAREQLDRFVAAGGALDGTPETFGVGALEGVIRRCPAPRRAGVTELGGGATEGLSPPGASANGARLFP